VHKSDIDGLFNLRGKIEFGLGPMKRLLEKLGHPEESPQIVHFAGTNGKGSTLVALEALLVSSGFKVVSFTSPHLVKLNERFRIDGQVVTDLVLEQALGQVCAALGLSISNLRQANRQKIEASFFEISFAIALLIGSKADWLLVETGLGGRLDATNAISSPVGCVITRVGMDHMEYLGTTIKEIASEKLGILKPGAKFFLAPQAEPVTLLARQKAKLMGLELYEVSLGINNPIPFGLKGEHQQENVATALCAYQKLCPSDAQLSQQAAEQCLKTVKWAGRLEEVGAGLLTDGAHNQDGICALMSYLKQAYNGEKILLALGWMQGKNLFESFDAQGINLTFLPLRGDFYRAEPRPELVLQSLGETLSPRSVKQAFWDWQKGAFKGYSVVVVAGSLYVVGELKALMA